MKENDSEFIKSILIKHMPSSCADSHIEIISLRLENKWFTPNGSISEHGLDKICNEWNKLGLMAKRIRHIWTNKNQSKRKKIDYLFRSDLNYTNLP